MNCEHYFYPESQFGGFADVDGTIAFFNRVHALLKPNHTILDAGCGRGEYGDDVVDWRRSLRNLKGKAAKVIGIDVSPAGGENNCIDEFRRIDGARWPVEDNSADVVLSDFVVEHLEKPGEYFSEARRVLRPGGYLCIRTPNKWNYIAIASRLIPNRYHSRVTAAVQEDRKEEDVFPTYYRCNSLGSLRRAYREAGFEAVVRGYEAQPSYLAFSSIAYGLGVLHQKLAPSFMRASLFGFGRVSKVAD